MAVLKKLPIGIENFEEIRTENFYYIDKTGLIRELLNNWGKVNLFTRPRRFGKSLNMSMLKNFFEYGGDVTLFDGLEWSFYSCYNEDIEPGWWSPADKSFGCSFFGTEKKAMLSLMSEPIYKQYFE